MYTLISCTPSFGQKVIYHSSFSCQIRSLQFDDFPSNWSEAKEIDFVVLRRPREVGDLEITFTEVEAQCNDTNILMELDGRVTWSEFYNAESDPVTFEYYKLSIGDDHILFINVRYLYSYTCRSYKYIQCTYYVPPSQ